MIQHSLTIGNLAGAPFRASAVNALQALGNNQAGPNPPPTTYPGLGWDDTTSGWRKKRNQANAGWIFVEPLAGHAEVDVAAAATVDLGAQTSDMVRITGTGGPITSFGVADAGRVVRVRHSAAATLTHNPTSLILPAGVDRVTAVNDHYDAHSLGAGAWMVRGYQKASGIALVETATGKLTAGTPAIQNPYALSATVAQAHGLSARPIVFDYVLECLDAELGFSIGDPVSLSPGAVETLSDATNITLIVSSSVIWLTHKTTYTAGAVTPSKWKLIVTPYMVN